MDRRRRTLLAAGSAALSSALPWLAPAAHGAEGPVETRPIPSSGALESEKTLLPAARDAGAAVLVNLPFGRNSLFRKAGNRPLPDFAAEFGARTWAQFFLKFILGHPAVTAVIPGTDKPEYMLDNLDAARGALPDAAMRRKIVQYWDSLT